MPSSCSRSDIPGNRPDRIAVQADTRQPGRKPRLGRQLHKSPDGWRRRKLLGICTASVPPAASMRHDSGQQSLVVAHHMQRRVAHHQVDRLVHRPVGEIGLHEFQSTRRWPAPACRSISGELSTPITWAALPALGQCLGQRAGAAAQIDDQLGVLPARTWPDQIGRRPGTLRRANFRYCWDSSSCRPLWPGRCLGR